MSRLGRSQPFQPVLGWAFLVEAPGSSTPIGTVWGSGTWADGVWADGTWAGVSVAPVDPFDAQQDLLVDLAPYALAQAITPSNTANFAGVGPSKPFCDAIQVGGAGIVPVVWPDGAVTNFTCVSGQRLRVRAKRVNATNCTATGLVALYRL